MSDNPSEPLLSSNERPPSKHSQHSAESHENTPLLSRTDSNTRYGGSEEQENDRNASPATDCLRSIHNGVHATRSNKDGRRWPTVVAVSVLALLVIGIILGAFFIPAAVEEYAKQALIIEPTSLSIADFTDTGVIARVQAQFRMDASRVENEHIRNIGRFGTWLAREVESEKSKVEVHLPEYGNILLGTAAVPSVLVDIRNGHSTAIDFLTALEPGNIEGIRQVANDWLEGRLDQIRVLGKAEVALKSGLFSLGTQTISESMVFEGNDLPAIPGYNITRLNFREVPIDLAGQRGMAADVSLSLVNEYPIHLDIPPLAFDILVPGCGVDDPKIRFADATTDTIHVQPHSDVTVDVGGIVRELSKPLLQACSDSKSSPLDILLGNYIHGNETTIFVQGSSSPISGTPDWIANIISSIAVPVPFPGHTFDNIIKNFSLTDTNFKMPNPFAQPGSSGSNPEISGTIVVTASLPDEMNFGINVTRVRANADVFYKGDKLGVLDLKKWQPAKSKHIKPSNGQDAALRITSRINNAPLNITDEDVFTDVLSELLFGDDNVMLKIAALVDVEVSTVLGKLVIKDMPAEGVVPVKPISTGDGNFGNLKPNVYDLRVLSSGKTSLNLEARVNFTNPTEYSAQVPYINIHILNNGSILGDATIRNASIVPGNNTNVLVQATWDPATLGGKNASKIGRELLSQYISGYNTTLTFQTHENSIPHHPELGRALMKFAIEMPTPKLSKPGSGNDKGKGGNGPQFIDDATFHLFSSTATFTLVSPLEHSTIFIDTIDATAFYNHTEPVGKINYNLPFQVPPGRSQSPRLPVDWSFDSVGYERLREALGGKLKLDAKGTVTVRLGQWTETVWYIGHGIGANVRF